MKMDLFIELNGKQIDYKTLKERVKKDWKGAGKKIKELETLKLYYKPDEESCYYIINGETKGKIMV